MEHNSVAKCRACLKKCTNTFPLNKITMGTQTYGQLLKECTSLEYPAVYEHLMPQYLCSLCYHELNRVYGFIRQVQYCNNKLIDLLAKQLQKAVGSTQNKLFKKDPDQNKGNENIINNEFRIVNASVLLKPVELEELSDDCKPIQCKVDDDNEAKVSDSSSCCNTNTAPPPITTATCPICGKTINGQNSLISHMRFQHDIVAPKKFLNQEKALTTKRCKRKIKSKPKERTFKCTSCNYIARTYMAIDFHIRSKHGSKDDKFKCNFCIYTTWTKFQLFMHVKKSHKEQIKALKMDAENTTDVKSESFQNELNIYEKNEVCDEKENLSVTQMVANTTTTIDDKEEEDLSDELFIRNLLNIKKRQQNQTKATNCLPRRCDECGNIYNNIQSLKTHKRNVHVSEEQLSPCPHCGKKFKNRKNMRAHIANAHNPDAIKIRKKPTKQTKEKCFLCSHCSYACTTKSILTYHVNRHHTGEKPYKCDVCNRAFVVPFDLKIHRYIHTGERPYKCSICSKRFRCSVHLVKHKRIHNNERPYKCKDCDKSFTQSSNLRLHKKRHLKEKNFKCMVCNKFFENQCLLNEHRIKEDHYDEIE